jgi:hypothetical protein
LNDRIKERTKEESILMNLSWEVSIKSCSGECLLSSDHGLDSVVHVLYEVLLRLTETALVRDVKDSITGVGGLSA